MTQTTGWFKIISVIAYSKLKSLLAEMGKVAIGYSGGVDSTLLAKVATDVLGDNAICVLVESCLVPRKEIDEAVEIAEQLHLNLVRLSVDILSVDKVPENPADRCYFCKKAIFGKIAAVAEQLGMDYILDGGNRDDESDYRPGAEAARELGVRSPFKEVGLTKEEIRSISREMNLPTWNKPSYACLASRIPYGTFITPEVLNMIDRAENALQNLGFKQLRVRHHGNIARIEIMPLDMAKAIKPAIRQCIERELKHIGYTYVTLDLSGLKSGSLNYELTVYSSDDNDPDDI